MGQILDLTKSQRNAMSILARYLRYNYKGTKGKVHINSHGKKAGLTQDQIDEILDADGIEGLDDYAANLKQACLDRAHDFDPCMYGVYETIYGESLDGSLLLSQTPFAGLEDSIKFSGRELKKEASLYTGTYTVFRYSLQSDLSNDPSGPVTIMSTRLKVSPPKDGEKLMTFHYNFFAKESVERDPYQVEGYVLPIGEYFYFVGHSTELKHPVTLITRNEMKHTERLDGLIMRTQYNGKPFASRVVLMKHSTPGRKVKHQEVLKFLPRKFDERFIYGGVSDEENELLKGLDEEKKHIRKEQMEEFILDMPCKLMLNTTGERRLQFKRPLLLI